MIVELDSRDEAMQMVPPELRQQVRIIKLNRFTREQMASRIAELDGRSEDGGTQAAD